MDRRIGAQVIGILTVGLAAYCAVIAIAFLAQRKLLYFPDTNRVLPAMAGLRGVEEVVLSRPGGVEVIGWFGKAQGNLPTLLYFHGNGGGLLARAERIGKYLSRGYGVFIMSYRGYSGSGGSPSEQANVADAMAAYDWLVASGVEPSRIALYGESLGSGVAVQVALEKRVAGVVLDAPYTSIPDIGQRHYWYLPVSLLMLDRYPTIRLIGDVKVPVLVIHGAKDEVTPVEMGKEVFAAANEPKELAIFAEAGHSDHHLHGAFETVDEWLRSLPLLDGRNSPELSRQ
jgi:uncharacterized protein